MLSPVFYRTVGKRPVILICALIAYSCVGGAVFSYLENRPYYSTPVPSSDDRLLAIQRCREQYTHRILEIVFDSTHHLDVSKTVNETSEALNWYESEVRLLSGVLEAKRSTWTLWSGICYAWTLYTTIGYGNLVPVTAAGRASTMLYALIGIPLMLSTLNNWGSLFFAGMQVLWRRVTLPVRHLKRNRAKSITAAEITEQWLSSDRPPNVPVTFVVFVLLIWLLVSSGLVCAMQGWDYFTAFYFAFITFTTIGLGDVVLDESSVGYTIVTALIILVCLSVISMAISVVHANMEAKFNRLIESIDQKYKAGTIGIDITSANVGSGKAKEGRTMENAFELQDIYLKQGLSDHVLMKFMSHHQKHMLQRHFEKRANMRHRDSQTAVNVAEASTQTVQSSTEFLSRERSQKRRFLSPINNFNPARKYIYNTGD